MTDTESRAAHLIQLSETLGPGQVAAALSSTKLMVRVIMDGRDVSIADVGDILIQDNPIAEEIKLMLSQLAEVERSSGVDTQVFTNLDGWTGDILTLHRTVRDAFVAHTRDVLG